MNVESGIGFKKYSTIIFWGVFFTLFSFFGLVTCVNTSWSSDAIPLPAVIHAMDDGQWRVIEVPDRGEKQVARPVPNERVE